MSLVSTIVFPRFCCSNAFAVIGEEGEEECCLAARVSTRFFDNAERNKFSGSDFERTRERFFAVIAGGEVEGTFSGTFGDDRVFTLTTFTAQKLNKIIANKLILAYI